MCGTAICSFGIYNVHDQSGITEGGALGLVLLLNHWFDIPSSLATPIIDIVCYVLAFRALGRKFLEVSAISTLSMAMFFRIWEHFPPVLPSLEDKPLLAALLGALFIGVGVGIVVKNVVWMEPVYFMVIIFLKRETSNYCTLTQRTDKTV